MTEKLKKLGVNEQYINANKGSELIMLYEATYQGEVLRKHVIDFFMTHPAISQNSVFDEIGYRNRWQNIRFGKAKMLAKDYVLMGDILKNYGFKMLEV